MSFCFSTFKPLHTIQFQVYDEFLTPTQIQLLKFHFHSYFKYLLLRYLLKPWLSETPLRPNNNKYIKISLRFLR